MKNSILLSALFVLFVFASSSSLTAQTKKTMLCDEAAQEFPITIKPRHCYPKSGYTLREALDDLGNELAAKKITCDPKECDGENFDCTPVGTYSTSDGNTYPLLDSTGTTYCFSGPVVIKGTCGPCTRTKKSTAIDGESSGEDSQQHIGHEDPDNTYSFSDTQRGDLQRDKAQLEKIYPNPSTGFFNLDVAITQNNSRVTILFSDLSGKIVHSIKHQNVPPSLFHVKGDLSLLESGLYLISVQVNDKIAGTSKLLIQK